MKKRQSTGRHSGAPSISGLPEIGTLSAKSAKADLDGGEPGIHNPRPMTMDSGPAGFARVPE
jgi:hypothetical protein